MIIRCQGISKIRIYRIQQNGYGIFDTPICSSGGRGTKPEKLDVKCPEWISFFFLLRASPGPPWYSIESMKGVERVPAQACVTSLIKIQHSLGSPLCSAADGDNFHLPAKPQTCWLLTQNIPISCQGHTLNHSWSSRRRRTAFTKWFCWILNIWKHSAFIRALI